MIFYFGNIWLGHFGLFVTTQRVTLWYVNGEPPKSTEDGGGD